MTSPALAVLALASLGSAHLASANFALVDVALANVTVGDLALANSAANVTPAHLASANLALGHVALASLALPKLASANSDSASIYLAFSAIAQFQIESEILLFRVDVFQDVGLWGTCKGRLGAPRKTGARGTRGGHCLDCLRKNKSKSPITSKEGKLGNKCSNHTK